MSDDTVASHYLANGESPWEAAEKATDRSVKAPHVIGSESRTNWPGPAECADTDNQWIGVKMVSMQGCCFSLCSFLSLRSAPPRRSARLARSPASPRLRVLASRKEIISEEWPGRPTLVLLHHALATRTSEKHALAIGRTRILALLNEALPPRNSSGG